MRHKFSSLCESLINLSHRIKKGIRNSAVKKKKMYIELNKLYNKFPSFTSEQAKEKVVTLVSSLRSALESDSHIHEVSLVRRINEQVRPIHSLARYSAQRFFGHVVSKNMEKRERDFRNLKLSFLINYMFERGNMTSDLRVAYHNGNTVIGLENTVPLIANHLKNIASNDAILSDEFINEFNLRYTSPPLPSLTTSDFTKVVKKKKARCPGASRFSLKLIQQCTPEIQMEVFKVLIDIWEQRLIPEHWCKKIIRLIPKKLKPEIKDFRPDCLARCITNTHPAKSKRVFERAIHHQLAKRPALAARNLLLGC